MGIIQGKEYIYISRATFDGHEHFVVNVPKGNGDYHTSTFSIGLYGEKDALTLAESYRDRMIANSGSLPSGLVLSRSMDDLTPSCLSQVRTLFYFQRNHAKIKVTTLAMLAMFANREATIRMIAEDMDREPTNLAKQIRGLVKRGWLKEVGSIRETVGEARWQKNEGSIHSGLSKRPSKLYTLSEEGLEIIREFRECFGHGDSGLLRGPKFYSVFFREIRDRDLMLGFSVISVMRLVEEGVYATSRISKALEVAQSEVSACLSRGIDYEILKRSMKHEYQLTDFGKRILYLLREF